MLINIGSAHSQVNGFFGVYMLFACALHIIWQLLAPWLLCLYRRGRQFLWWLAGFYILLAPAFLFMLFLLGDVGKHAISFDAIDMVISAAMLSSFGSLLLLIVAAVRIIKLNKNNSLAQAHYYIFWLGTYLPALIFCVAFINFWQQYFR